MVRSAIKKMHLQTGVMILLLYGAGLAAAQNINYSQYQNTPFFTNPALAGAKSEISLSAIHRSQQLSNLDKYNMSSVMVVAPLMDPKKGTRWGGWGVSLMNDQLKGGIAYQVQGVSGAYSYNLQLFKGHYISFGMQGGYYQRKLSMDGLTTSSQWVDNVGFNPEIGIGESFSGERKGYLSLGTGFLFYTEDEEERQKARFGVAAYNVNRPDASFTEQRDIIPLKLTALGSLALMSSEKYLVTGEMLFYRENNRNTYHIGGRASYYFGNNNPYDALKEGSVDFKAGYRVNNAITTEIQFHQPNFSVGFAYDFGIASKESPVGPNDVVEVLFTLKKQIRIKKAKTPATRQSYATIGQVREFYFGRGQQPAAGQEDNTSGDNASDNPETMPATADGNFEFKLQQDFKFGFNEAVLNEDAKKYLDDMVNLLNGNRNFMLEVIGHTDNVGTSQANKEVSLKRASVVIDYLIEKGIAPSRLRATPVGAKQPLVPNDSEENRARNRRVEFVIRDAR